MVGSTIGGGSCGDAPPPPPQQFLSSSSSLRPYFPSCDSEEFSALFNQLLSPEMDHNNNNNIVITRNRVLHPSSSSSSSSVFNFSSHHNINDPFDHNNNNTNNDDDYILAPLLPSNSNANNTNNKEQQHSITCSIQKNGEDSELPSKPVPPPRTSSKRSRAAEFHNLSEKRRRSRINEKMKALQNLIPNSNKTDKASMLDEAIEYLKQLQLQVQMLMMRNGLSLHPMSLPGGLRPMVLPHSGLNFDEGNGLIQNSIGGIVSSANGDESTARPSFGFPKQCSISNQPAVMPSLPSIATSDTSSFQPSIKDAQCNNMPQLLLDTTRIGKTPSPDVS